MYILALITGAPSSELEGSLSHHNKIADHDFMTFSSSSSTSGNYGPVREAGIGKERDILCDPSVQKQT